MCVFRILLPILCSFQIYKIYLINNYFIANVIASFLAMTILGVYYENGARFLAPIAVEILFFFS